MPDCHSRFVLDWRVSDSIEIGCRGALENHERRLWQAIFASPAVRRGAAKRRRGQRDFANDCFTHTRKGMRKIIVGK